ncbi:hypothetical protein FACS1894145_7530 [Bacteroidia bacterium]|nr:hypothetical protein FACS1894145_7530 [Bacteroidia bacterium]
MRNIFVSNVRGAICCYFADKTLESFISDYYPSDYENQDQTIPDPPANAKYVIFNYPQNTVMDNSNFKIIADGEFEIAKTFEPVVGDGRGFRWDVFGDSLSTDWYHGVETWNSKVQKKLKITDRRNYSEGGAVWTDNATGWQKFSEQVLQAISYNTQDNRIPDLITISLGTNNIVSDMSDYDAIMSIAWGADGSGISRSTVFGGMRWGFETLKRAYPLAVIIATTPLPRGDGDYSQQVIAMGDSIKKMAKAYGIIVADAYAEAGWSEIIDKTIATDVDPIQMGNYWFYDKLHASEGGSEMMAKYMASKIMPFMI